MVAEGTDINKQWSTQTKYIETDGLNFIAGLVEFGWDTQFFLILLLLFVLVAGITPSIEEMIYQQSFKCLAGSFGARKFTKHFVRNYFRKIVLRDENVNWT